MRTKTLSLLLVILMSGMVASGQGIKPGIVAGVNFQNINGKDYSGDKLEYDLLTGFHVGANLLFPISEEIGFQPGILYSSKGTVISKSPDSKLKISYVEIPLNVLYRGQLGNNFVLLGFGPYAAFGVGGEVSVDKLKTDLEFGNEADITNPFVVKRFDAGANIFAGYELGNGLLFQLNAQLGLLKVNPDVKGVSDGKTAWKNTGFGLSLGYRF